MNKPSPSIVGYEKSDGRVGDAGLVCACLNLHDELAALLNYIGKVATKIRFLGQHKKQEPTVFSDVVWLGDSLHKLHHLGEAILLLDRQAITIACDWLIADYEDYRNDEGSKAAFSRNGLSLDEAAKILAAIKLKARSM